MEEDLQFGFDRGEVSPGLTFLDKPNTKKAIRNIVVLPVTVSLESSSAATAANYSIFFIADRSYEIESITEVHGTAGTDGSAVTLQIQKLTGTTAVGSGADVLNSTFNLKGTANTVQYGSLTATENRVLERGDRLSLEDTGTLTSLADLCVTVYLRIL